MAKRRVLFVEHMENVSWRVLQDYPQVARDLIRGRNGIYALYRRDKLYYVGLATSLMGRVKHHLRDRHHGKWDRFSVYLTATIISASSRLWLSASLGRPAIVRRDAFAEPTIFAGSSTPGFAIRTMIGALCS